MHTAFRNLAAGGQQRPVVCTKHKAVRRESFTGALEQEVGPCWPCRLQIDEGPQVLCVGAVLHEAMRSLQ